jgi:peptide deformylase
LTINQKELELIKYPNKILQTKAVNVELFDKNRLENLFKIMTSIMNILNGVGLAANQVGLNDNLFVANISFIDSVENKVYEKPNIFINPTIIKKTYKTNVKTEGCLSVDNYTPKIERHKEIILEFQTIDGLLLQIPFKDFDARVIQHEIDHLNGITLANKIDNLK